MSAKPSTRTATLLRRLAAGANVEGAGAAIGPAFFRQQKEFTMRINVRNLSFDHSAEAVDSGSPGGFRSKYGVIENTFTQKKIITGVFNDYGERNDVTDRGVCMSMSAFYLIKQALGEDFFCWLSEKEARWAVLSQYLDSDYRPLPPIDAQRSIQASIANAGLKHEGSFTLKAKDYCSDTVADSMSTDALETCEARMCYFHTPDGPAHAVATLVKNRGEIRIMDPNFGEVSFRNQVEFGHWMSEVFNKHYAGYSNLTVAYYSMGRQDGSEADHSR